MIDLDDIRTRYQQACKFLDERGRRLFAANEALALGHGGVTATSAATGLARSTIRRAIMELQSGANPIGPRVRRKGGGRKSAVTLQPELPSALETLIEDAIRGDPETPLRWVIMLAPLGFVMAMSFGLNRMSTATLQLLYWAFTVVMGLSMMIESTRIVVRHDFRRRRY